MSFVRSLKRNLAYLRLSAVVKLQHPLPFLVSLCLGPFIQFSIEALFWSGCFEVSGRTEIGGFSLWQYLSYLIWLVLNLGGANWRFERGMIRDINSGAINAMLVRPGSYFGLQFGDLLGFKLMGLMILLPLMLSIVWLLDLPIMLERLPLSLLMGLMYLLFIHTLNFTLASMAFLFDHVYSLNTTKNMLLWVLTGELFPLDLLPVSISQWIIRLPFSCGIYLPASYMAGRIEHAMFFQGFISLILGMGCMAVIARLAWRKGLKNYTGTGS